MVSMSGIDRVNVLGQTQSIVSHNMSVTSETVLEDHFRSAAATNKYSRNLLGGPLTVRIRRVTTSERLRLYTIGFITTKLS